MPLQIDLSGKVAFVSGASSGIGLGVAERLAAAGCHIIGCGTRSETSAGAQAFLAAVREHGQEAAYFKVDLTTVDVEQLAKKSAAIFGRIDILVSNAGRNIFKGAKNCTVDEWDECMNLDLGSHWRLALAMRPHLYANTANPGVIIIMGSNHGFNTIPGCFPYNVAKAGLLGVVQSLAIEWGPHIRTVGIAPGFIDTPGNDTWFANFPDSTAERQRTEQSHPVGCLGSVEEIGGLCAFLSSDYGNFISGTTLIIDGGRSALMQDSSNL